MIQITLAYSREARQVLELALEVPDGCTCEQALALSGWQQQFPELSEPAISLGIWGRKVSKQTPLLQGDRLEIYRGLRVDPKVARRERFVGQGARTAGLFSKRRPNSKSGY